MPAATKRMIVLRARPSPYFLQSDLPDLARDLPSGRFPCVKLRGNIAIIALSIAVPRPPFVSAGYLGHAQLEAFQSALAHPEVRARMPVVLIHHPPVDSRSRLMQLRDGLVDAAHFRSALIQLARGVVLFGHIHVRARCTLRTPTGELDVVGASGLHSIIPIYRYVPASTSMSLPRTEASPWRKRMWLILRRAGWSALRYPIGPDAPDVPRSASRI
ncbi:MAG: metallophosphoesterase family protein [Xanthobacteraceae bacterium]